MAFEDLPDELEGAGAAAQRFMSILDGMPGKLSASASAASGFRGTLSALTGGASESAGPLSAVGNAVASVGAKASEALGPTGSVGKALGALGPEGEAAAAALQVVTAALTATIGALLAFGQAAIQVTQQRSALLATFAALGGGQAAGASTLAMVQKLGTSLPFATSQIAAWARSLEAAGVQGKDLEGAIRAVAAAQALMGDSGAAATQNLIKRLAEGGEAAKGLMKQLQAGGPRSSKLLAEMGLQTRDLAAAMGMTEAQFKRSTISAEQMQKAIEKALQKKGAGPLGELGLTFPALVQKVREGFLSLFDALGPAVKPFMQAIKSLFGEFSKGGGAINALKPIVTSVMTTLFAWATRAVTAVHAIVTWLLNSGKAGGVFSSAISVLKTTWAALVAIFGAVRAAMTPIIGVLKAIFSNALVLDGIRGMFRGIAIIIGIVVVAFAALTAVVAVVVGVFAAMAGAIGGALAAVAGVIFDVVDEIVAALSGLTDGAGSAASGFVDGLVSGIEAGIGSVVGAVAGLASSALSAFTGVFGIKSPSTVMRRHGQKNIAEDGLAEGIDRGGDKVDDAMAGLGGEPPGGGARGKGGAGSKVYNIVFQGKSSEFVDFREQAEKWLEEIDSEGPSPELA